MPVYKNNIDLYFTAEGDYVLSPDGDLLDTKRALYRGFIQQVLTRLQSSRNDWRDQPDTGANFGEFVGLPNTRETGDLIISRVSSELIREGLVSQNDLNVDVVPLNANSIMVLVTLIPPGSSQAAFLSFTYDMRDNKLIPRNI